MQATETQSNLLLLDRRMQSLVVNYLPKGKALEDLSEFFRLFADVTRLKILSTLSISPMCVTDLARILMLNQTTVSHQLKTLKSLNMVQAKRQGKIIFYQLSDKKLNEIMLWGVEYLGY